MADKFYDEYDKQVIEVLESRDYKKYLDHFQSGAKKFPTLQECVYNAMYQSDPKLLERYTDYTLETVNEGKEELYEVAKCRAYGDRHPLATKWYSKYYDEKIESRLEDNEYGITERFCYETRFHRNPELAGKYKSYELEQVIQEDQPNPFVEKCREEYNKISRKRPFYQFFYDEFYEYDYLYRNDPALFARYTDCTLMTLRDGMEEIESVRKKREDCKKTYDKESPEKSFWCYFCKKYYHDLKDALPAAELAFSDTLKFFRTWRKTEKWKGKGYTFHAKENSADSARNIVLHLALVLGLDVDVLNDLLQRGLIQPELNAKDPKEAIFAYCLFNLVPFKEMLKEYWEYSESRDFREKYIDIEHKCAGQALDTQNWSEKLKMVLDKDREEFFLYLGELKYNIEDTNNTVIPRRTPSAVFLDAVLAFPKTIWTDDSANANNLISAESLYEKYLKKTYPKKSYPEKDAWLCSSNRRSFKTIEEMYDSVKKFDEERNNSAKYKKRKANDYDKEEQDDIEARETRYITIEQHRYFQALILEKSCQNCYVHCHQNGYDLPKQESLKIIFENLKYTEATLRKHCTGEVELTRSDLLAAIFLNTSFEKLDEEIETEMKRPKHPYSENDSQGNRWIKFRKETDETLELCGQAHLYERSPLDLFLKMCMLMPEPHVYFLASLEKYHREEEKQQCGGSDLTV